MAITVVVMLALFPFARVLGLIDHPTDRKNHDHAMPATGGVAMFVGIVATVLWVHQPNTPLTAYLVAAAILIVTGWLDDRFDLRWWIRIAIQVVAAFVLVAGGVCIEHIGPVFGVGDLALGALSLPLTVIATVGLINALNMIDGVDGLAGTLTLATLVMVLAAARYSGNDLLVERSVVLIGAVSGFLLFNFRFPWRQHARAFMGNSGSALLGLTIAWCCFRLTQNNGHPVSPMLALWLAPVPVIDCLVLMVRRRNAGRSPFAADHNHVHHLMRDAGFGPCTTSLGLAMFTLICGLAAGQCLRWDVPEPLLLIAYAALLAGWFAITAKREHAVALFRAARFWSRLTPVSVAQAKPGVAQNEA